MIYFRNIVLDISSHLAFYVSHFLCHFSFSFAELSYPNCSRQDKKCTIYFLTVQASLENVAIKFELFYRVGFPIMLTSTATITIYLMIAHVVFHWD